MSDDRARSRPRLVVNAADPPPEGTAPEDYVMLAFLDGIAEGQGNVPNAAGSRAVVLHRSQIGWPPPAMLAVQIRDGMLRVTNAEAMDDGETVDALYRRESYSAITDEQAAQMTHVMRGGAYREVVAR